ncbi:substrate-binding periplasmic protein [Hwanghaeella sp.]|uniref:substrate-binding periplasmic protein n=1 Tax=Hwanghaeella sp. TaxID=2605943 RepID=UPI003CCB9984
MFSVLPAAADEIAPQCRPGERVVLAAEDGFFPYTGLYKGQLRGFSLDIVTAAFAAVGCAVEFRQMPYSRCLREVQAGRISGCFNTTNSDENLLKYIFHSAPLFHGRILVYGPPGFKGPFTDAEFERSTFSVVRGYTYTDAFDNNPQIEKIEVESDLQTLALVSRGRADFAVVYERVAQFHIGNNANQVTPAPVPVASLTEFDLFVSFSKANLEKSVWLAHALDLGLGQIHKNGVYSGIEAVWDEWLQSGVGQGKPAPYWTNGSS